MQKAYYYFVAGLPNISFDDGKAILTPDAFWDDARDQLSAEDLGLLKLLYLPDDLDNFLGLVYKEEKAAGTDTKIELEIWENLVEAVRENPGTEQKLCLPSLKGVPEFVIRTAQSILSEEKLPELIQAESLLLSGMYEFLLKMPNRFLRAWFRFNQDLKNISIAINGRKHDYPYTDFLLGENELVEALSRSQAADFGLGKHEEIYDAVNRIFEQYNLLDRERNLDALRWRWIEDHNFFEFFSIDRILGYFCQLRILHRWISLDPEMGKDVFFDTLETLENSFSFPEEYDLKHKVKR
ncbi:MAG: DUF2764 family protein [Candidatus Cloacimonetes bacterium]|nr:DUF2764 family protein [Candidatus Cloacimonadota bacterium]